MRWENVTQTVSVLQVRQKKFWVSNTARRKIFMLSDHLFQNLQNAFLFLFLKKSSRIE